MSKFTRITQYQLPEYVREEYPTFVNFVEAYHDYLETNQANIKTIADIDTVSEEFLEHYKNEINHIGMAFPYVDQKFMLRHIKNLYLSKGTEESYVTLFRILYNKEVMLKFPEKQVLKSSDGKWIQRYSIFVEELEGDGSQIKDTIVRARNPQTNVEIKLTIEATEIARQGDGVSTIQLLSGGSGYVQESTQVIISGGGGSGAAAVATVVGGAITQIKVTNMGQGYTSTPVVTIIGAGTGAEIKDVIMYVRSHIYEMTIDKNFYGTLSVGDDVRYGTFRGKVLPTINSFSIQSPGAGFRLGQTFDITTTFGTGATIKVTKIDPDTKGITEVKFIKFGFGYISDFESLNIIPSPLSASMSESTILPRATLSTLGIIVTGGINAKVTIGNLTKVYATYDVVDQATGTVLGTVKNVLVPVNVSTASWAASEATFTTASNHLLEIGSEVTVSGVVPSGYNGTFVVTATPSATQFKVAMVSDPGAYTSGGVVTPITGFTLNAPIANNAYTVAVYDSSEIVQGNMSEHLEDQTSSGYILQETYFANNPAGSSFGYDYAGVIAREFYSHNSSGGNAANRAILAFKLGSICKYPGYFDASDGKLSDDIKIQDSKFYQKYSCVVQVDLPLADYKESVTKYVHPAGVALFGEYSMSTNISLAVKLKAILSAFSIHHADGAYISSGLLNDNGLWIDAHDIDKIINDVSVGGWGLVPDHTAITEHLLYHMNKIVNDESSTALGIPIDHTNNIDSRDSGGDPTHIEKIVSDASNVIWGLDPDHTSTVEYLYYDGIKIVNDEATNALGLQLNHTAVSDIRSETLMTKIVNDESSNALGLTIDHTSNTDARSATLIDKPVNDASNVIWGLAPDETTNVDALSYVDTIKILGNGEDQTTNTDQGIFYSLEYILSDGLDLLIATEMINISGSWVIQEQQQVIDLINNITTDLALDGDSVTETDAGEVILNQYAGDYWVRDYANAAAATF